MSERGNPQLRTTFDRLGAYAEKNNDIRRAIRFMGKADISDGPSGHPDYIVLFPPFGFFIEVKSTDSRNPGTFALAEISAKQREWLSRWSSISYLWLFVGNHRPDSGHIFRKRAFLVPWPKWLEVERSLSAWGLKSLALVPKQIRHREAGLGMKDLLGQYELEWIPGGAWTIPERNPFWNIAPIGGDWRLIEKLDG